MKARSIGDVPSAFLLYWPDQSCFKKVELENDRKSLARSMKRKSDSGDMRCLQRSESIGIVRACKLVNVTRTHRFQEVRLSRGPSSAHPRPPPSVRQKPALKAALASQNRHPVAAMSCASCVTCVSSRHWQHDGDGNSLYTCIQLQICFRTKKKKKNVFI